LTTIYMKKIGKALVPDSDEEAEKLQRFKGVIKCEITEMRNGPFFANGGSSCPLLMTMRQPI
jgi:hypothetical protein